MGAVAAVGAGLDDALALGPAAEADIEEAAKGQARDAREDGSQNANHDPKLSIRLYAGLLGSRRFEHSHNVRKGLLFRGRQRQVNRSK